ncbi:substrate-binding domain-containing protein [Lichenicoccus roseus]|uniref:ABC transporter substrate-binding protein n=1 Tax=Lichenicoccus roseus TaxID=2683649 RepID=A0A5R9JCI8_9PROT|nr:substrate-binding domain-containing protein [Lichenicoccus roseus]TLU73096.1 ABC transporter substrate-binding protein [Lichenicoccus roseus]
MKISNLAACLLAGAMLASGAMPANAATYDPQCFRAAAAAGATVQLPAKHGPYRIAFANGFIGNGWRVQMIQTLRAYAAQPDVAKQIKELRIVSVGTDVSAQIAAMDNFINAGFDAILIDANSPTAFKPVLRRAQKAGVLIVSFDNTFDRTGKETNLIQVNQDQRAMGQMMGDWLNSTMKEKKSVLEVRGVPGNSVDRDRHEGFRAAMAKDPGVQITEVVGNWDDGTGQKAVADALAVHGNFDGIYTQGGSIGVTHAVMDAGKGFIPIAGEGENGFRKLIVAHANDGLLGDSAGQSPALVAVALKAALAALDGRALPQEIAVPIPEANYKTLVAGKTYFPDVSDTFFAASDFPVCSINLGAKDILGASGK